MLSTEKREKKIFEKNEYNPKNYSQILSRKNICIIEILEGEKNKINIQRNNTLKCPKFDEIIKLS